MMSNVIYVWDLPLRIFHWLLVITLVLSYLTGKQNGLWLEWHARLGLLIIALLVFRVVWGFVGSTYARFRNFLPTPADLRNYLSSEWFAPGHTPLGALSIFAMLSLALAQAGTGLFAMEEDIEFYAPLYELASPIWSERLTRWHTSIVDWMIFFIALHLSAIAYYLLVKRKNLILPMLTGKQTVTECIHAQPTHVAGKSQLMLAVSASALVVWLITSGILIQ